MTKFQKTFFSNMNGRPCAMQIILILVTKDMSVALLSLQHGTLSNFPCNKANGIAANLLKPQTKTIAFYLE